MSAGLVASDKKSSGSQTFQKLKMKYYNVKLIFFHGENMANIVKNECFLEKKW